MKAPVIVDGEPVDLLLDGAAVFEKQRIVLQQDLLSFSVHQRPGPVAVILGHAQYRYLKSQSPKHLLSRSHLSPSSVHEDQVRKFIEAPVVFKGSAESSHQHFLKAAVVIRTFDGADLESSVVLSYRFKISEYHHGSHGIHTVGVADIVGLHAVAPLFIAQDPGKRSSQFLLPFLLGLHLYIQALGDLHHVS